MPYLHELPEDHPDRNCLLSSFWYRHKTLKTYREIMPTFGIAKKSFNELGPSWRDNDVFCREKPE